MRVISSPSISTTGLLTLIFATCVLLQFGRRDRRPCGAHPAWTAISRWE
jgi:hypothetical protein